jgi:hypothetical protein
VTDRGFESLVGQNLRVLNIHNCRFLTTDSLEALNRQSESLVDLNIGNTIRFLPEYVCSKMDEDQVNYKSNLKRLSHIRNETKLKIQQTFFEMSVICKNGKA